MENCKTTTPKQGKNISKIEKSGNISSDKKPFKCEFCQAAFSCKISIKKHKKMGTMADALLMKCGPPYAEKKPGH